MESRNKKHPKLVGKDYYTQEQLAEIIQYAAQRNIEVIPELDIPGHTVAILAAYPELGCTHTDTLPKIVGKTTDLMLCANNQKVYSVYQDIIKEISSLFPSDYIHLGGDEAVIEKNWTQCTRLPGHDERVRLSESFATHDSFFQPHAFVCSRK